MYDIRGQEQPHPVWFTVKLRVYHGWLVPFIILYFINEEKSNTCGINFVGDLVDNSYNQGMKHAKERELCFTDISYLQ